jgi:trk system potassium uptake protein TrkA
MRLIIVGASALGTQLTRIQIRQGNEVVLIERDEEIARDLAEELDCTVINAEGTRPDILEKAGIEAADAVVACTNHDQDNILIGLIAREAGIEKTIIKTDDEKFMQVAKKLGFTYLINPPQVSSTIITDVLRGVDTIQLSNLVRTDVRFISFLAGELHKGRRIS